MLDIPAGAGLTFGLLTAAIAALWLPRSDRALPAKPFASRLGGPWWLVLLAAAAVSANYHGVLTGRGILALAALGLAAHAANRPSGSALHRGLASLVAAVLAVGLMAHVMPGFTNPRVIDSVTLSPGSIPYSKYLNFDKAAAGLLLLAFAGASRARAGDWRRVLSAVVRLAPATALVLLVLSWALGYVAWEPGWPPILLFWIWTNLAFTCVAEEALFRGLIQHRLGAWLARYRHGGALALLAAAVLFGLAHAAGGWRYVALSTVAGLGYGWAYQRSGRIEASIATHFLVNLTHFTLFTYPALAPG